MRDFLLFSLYLVWIKLVTMSDLILICLFCEVITVTHDQFQNILGNKRMGEGSEASDQAAREREVGRERLQRSGWFFCYAPKFEVV